MFHVKRMADPLTPREAEVAHLVGVECLSTKAAARRIGLSFRTVEMYRGRVLRKLGCRNTPALARHLALAERGG